MFKVLFIIMLLLHGDVLVHLMSNIEIIWLDILVALLNLVCMQMESCNHYFVNIKVTQVIERYDMRMNKNSDQCRVHKYEKWWRGVRGLEKKQTISSGIQLKVNLKSQ